MASTAAPLSARSEGQYYSFQRVLEACHIKNKRVLLVKNKDMDDRLPTLACQILSQCPLTLTQRLQRKFAPLNLVQIDLPNESGQMTAIAIQTNEVATIFGIEKNQGHQLISSYEYRQRASELLARISQTLHDTEKRLSITHTATEVHEIVRAVFSLSIHRLLNLNAPMDNFVEASSSHQIAVQANMLCFKTGPYINEGGFGYVFQSMELFGRQAFAVKLAREDNNIASTRYYERANLLLRREVSTLQTLNRNGSVSGIQSAPWFTFCIKGGSKGDREGYITDLYEGELLLQPIQSSQELFSIMTQLICGLRYLSYLQLYHSDIKPSNILRRENFAVIADVSGIQGLETIEEMLRNCLKLALKTRQHFQTLIDDAYQYMLSIHEVGYDNPQDHSLLRHLLNEFHQAYQKVANQLQDAYRRNHEAALQEQMTINARQTVESPLASPTDFTTIESNSISDLVDESPSACSSANSSVVRAAPLEDSYIPINAFALRIYKIMQGRDIYNLALSLLMLIDECTDDIPSVFDASYWSKIRSALTRLKVENQTIDKLVLLFQDMTSSDKSPTYHQLLIEKRLFAFERLEALCQAQCPSALAPIAASA